jgi:hypothetical protein
VFRPGEQVTKNWSAYPLHEGYNVNLAGAANPQPWVPSASRAGNTLTLDVTPFSDSTPGHLASGLDAGNVTGHYRIQEDGKQIAAGNPFTPNPLSPFGEFATRVTLSPHPGVVRFTLSAAMTGPAAQPLSTASQTVWAWRSAPQAGAQLPAGWTCKLTAQALAHPDRTCAVEPMMTLDSQVAGLGLDGSAPAGRQVLRLSAGHLQLAKAPAITKATVSVSFDGGKTWHAATVAGHAGHYTATFTAPAGAKVTLRTSAADAAGGTITETITSAYQTGS